MILYNLKDSNGMINIVTNVAILNAIYIFLNTVRTKSTAARKANIATMEKNAVTTNRKAKIKRKSTRNFARYILFSLTTIMITNRFISPLLPLFSL